MVKLLGGRAASAVMGLFMLAVGSSAAAQDARIALNVPAAVTALDVDTSAPGRSARSRRSDRPAVAATTAVASADGDVVQAQPAQIGHASSSAVDRDAKPPGSTRAAGRSMRWSTSTATGAPLDEQANCLATAVYFEARGESRSRASSRSPGSS